MSQWDEDPRREYGAGGNIQRNLLIGAVCAGLVIAWMVFASPGEVALSTSGFNMGSAGGAPSSGRAFASRPQSSLDMVNSRIGSAPDGVTPGLLPGSSEPEAQPEPAETPAAAASPPVTSGPPPPAAPVPSRDPAAMPPPTSAADEAKALASAGIPTDARGLSNLGATDGLLTNLAAKLLDHPKVLAAVFNNKTVVNAFMNRAGVKENCQDAGKLKTYLSDPNSSGMTGVFPVIQKALSSPTTASGLVSALAGTEMAKQVGSCPSLQKLGGDSTAITSIAMSNPKALGLLMDPRGMAAVASNPQAAGVLAGVQAKMGGMGGAP